MITDISTEQLKTLLEELFPWLLTDDEVSGADVIDGISELYNCCKLA